MCVTEWVVVHSSHEGDLYAVDYKRQNAMIHPPSRDVQ